MAARRIVSYYEICTDEDVELGDTDDRGEEEQRDVYNQLKREKAA